MHTPALLGQLRRQHAIGQGFFHSAVISYGRARLRYVYDCGSDSMRARDLQHEVDNYRDTLESPAHLDLVFVSHLHNDHVNGLPFLLGRPLRVDRVFLPYFTPVERLVLACIASPARRNDHFYSALLSDPPRWFRTHGAEKVYYVPGSGPEAPTTPPQYPDKKSDRSSKEEESLEVDDGLEVLEPRHITHPAVLGEPSGPIAIDHCEPITVTSKGLARPAPDELWSLKMHVDPDWVGRARLAAVTAKKLGMPVEELEGKVRDLSAFRSLLASKQHVRTVRKSYEEASGKRPDLNCTSMSLFSGPTMAFCGCHCGSVLAHWDRRLWRRDVFASDQILGAWLGTGDAEIGANNEKRLQAFLAHYQNELRAARLTTLTLPHHGSRNNFSPVLIDRVNPLLSVVSAASFSKHRHPHPHVMEQMLHEERAFAVVTERSSGLWEYLHWCEVGTKGCPYWF